MIAGRIGIQMSTKQLDLMSFQSIIQIWSERVQKNDNGVNLLNLPLEYHYFKFECTISPPESAGLNRKRRRPLSDVDGGASESKKKRRLRSNLTTSRLSRAFSSPATYIYDRYRSKSAWARKPLERSIMRKAAMLNRFRIRKFEEQREAAMYHPPGPRPRLLGPPQRDTLGREERDVNEEDYL